MAPSIPPRSRKRRTPHGTSTVEEKHDRGRRRRKLPEKNEDGGRRTASTAVSLEQSTLMDSNASYLPQEIFTNILKRLPVKSLIRFQCVCKDWKNLFKIPSFIAEHVCHSTQQDSLLPFKCWDYLCLINRDMQVLKYETPHAPSLVDRCDIIGSSNGLLCLDYKSSFILWNPATREVLRVPEVPGICEVGFGFSPILNDYKIVSLSLSRLDDVRVYLVQVFSLTTRSWKEVEVGKLKGIMPFVSPGFSFDGAIFWFGFCKPKERCLISFDIAAESFALIPIPRSAHATSSSRLTAYENKLAMLSTTGVESKSGIESTESFCMNFAISLWVIGKCVDISGERWIWTKVYTTNPFPDRTFYLSPLTIWRNEIVGVGVTKGEKVLVFCNLHTNELKMLAMGKYSIGTVIWHYAKSLRDIHIEASSF